ncbi:unnamed protein product [Haemonchus placei]|uniref:Bromo domain-containing protein n=1 Tax=Haemonchus placei TaxID=6290 RepID=A0A0N4X4A8_HAEPC|nr:unnamed protein product [Haemonchus placei]
MDKSSRSQSDRSRKKSDKSHSDSTKGSNQEKPLKVGSAEKMLPSPAGSTPLMKKGNSKKRDSELKLRDLAEVIKQPLTSREFEVYLNRLAHFAIEYYNDPTVYDVTPST